MRKEMMQNKEQSLQEKVKQLVAVGMQEFKPHSTLNLSQTQNFILHCSGSPLSSHRKE
jgi:hypothetical protein